MLDYDADDKLMMLSAAKDKDDDDDNEDDSMTFFSRWNVHWNLNFTCIAEPLETQGNLVSRVLSGDEYEEALGTSLGQGLDGP